MLKRFLCLVMCLFTLLLPHLALAQSRGREPLFTFALDQAGTQSFKQQSYFKGRWVQVTAPVDGTHDLRLEIYADLDQNASTKDSRAYSRTFKGVSGTFTSPEIYLDFKKSATVPYRIDLYADDALLYRVYVYRMLLTLNNNTFTTRGIRFRDMNSAITDKWMMFTPIDLDAIDPAYGTQVIDLVGSNMYIVGKLTITRNDDQFMFSIEDIDTWNAGHAPESFYPDEPYVDIYDPFYPLDANHHITFSDVRMELMGSLTWVESVEHADMDTFLKLDRWYSIPHTLGGETVWALYLNGRVSYDPNGLTRINDTYDDAQTRPLRTLLQSLPNATVTYK